MREKYYVYVLQNPRKPLRRPDKYNLRYEPFYVGKGKNNRAEVHYQNFSTNNSSHTTKLLAELTKLKSQGVKPIVSKIYFSYDEEKTYEKESEVINFYGLRYKDGLLVNSSSSRSGGWGGELNPTYDRMSIGTHNFIVNNPQVDTPKIHKLKKMIKEVDAQESISTNKWLKRTGYSNIKSLKIGIKRLIDRDKLPYVLEGNNIKKLR